MMHSLMLAAPAKINLILKVFGLRTDGYHELETVMHPISLIDIIHVELIPEGITVESNSSHIPAGKDNLAYQAAALFKEETGIKAGVKIFIEKNIPVGAGLAGGSTDAAAVLKGLNHLFQTKLSLTRLREMAGAIGSDVPYCLLSETALARGRGEVLTTLDRGTRLNLLLVVPDFQVSTAEVYRAYQFEHSLLTVDMEAFLNAWRIGDLIKIAESLYNDLETVSIREHHEIGKIKTEIIKAGAVNALMSGSGPAVFGIFTDQKTTGDASRILKKSYKQVYQVTSYYRSDELWVNRD
ncbi:MAG TPA: 4-(cytidine 5'-diphospho)-2-C-methyl-D-erythritol kinase [Syntrophomonadaceae bacterium]|jgi:4-diphosphocytidyl-2-C-methyl-D-erythritol kinase|nr:4-(cytidine 5'-diphospho)-2-C-methyl-D-erythritol kinase [Syntrophomonadaceae bacterium]HRX20251.1 4-(cytidine 5'-diphospho)-2-C-methyl-D-erythritol kinase [Syntrophomonadaceae bacterium]